MGGWRSAVPVLAARPGWVWGVLGLLPLGALLGAALLRGARRWGGRRRRRRLQRVGTVLKLFVYPVKSCRGIAVGRAQVTPMGLQTGELRDRFWLVVKEDGHMVTARQEPRLVLVSVDSEDGHLVLEAPEMNKVSLPVKLPRKNPVRNCRYSRKLVRRSPCLTAQYALLPWLAFILPLGEHDAFRLVLACAQVLGAQAVSAIVHLAAKGCTDANLENWVFGLDIQGRDCGDEVAQWITTFLKSEPYRLVHFESSMVPRKSKDSINLFRSTDEVAYPDCSPALIISEASLEDLNSRLEKKVKIENFRPNILVTDCSPFEEDTWEDILIGDVEMKGTVCCARCILTTVNPDTGVLDRKEPLETLKSYRMCDPSERHIYKSSPLFGRYFAIDKTGTIRVGDPVYKMVQE